MGLRCVYCGKHLTKSEQVVAREGEGFQGVYSLREKLFRLQDHTLKTLVIHTWEAGVLLAQGNGFAKGLTFCRRHGRRFSVEYGVLNGKLYVDDLPHCGCGQHHRMLTPGQINRLLNITSSPRAAVSPKMREKVLGAYGHRCARCRSPEELEIHHRRSVVHGGTNELSNLVALCHHCHLNHSGNFSDDPWPDLEKALLESE